MLSSVTRGWGTTIGVVSGQRRSRTTGRTGMIEKLERLQESAARWTIAAL